MKYASVRISRSSGELLIYKRSQIVRIVSLNGDKNHISIQIFLNFILSGLGHSLSSHDASTFCCMMSWIHMHHSCFHMFGLKGLFHFILMCFSLMYGFICSFL